MAGMGRNAGVREGAAAKAEQRKKIIAIGGSVVLVALLAFQIPRTLKRLHPAAPVSASATATTPDPTATGTGTTGSAVPTRAQQRLLKSLKVHDPFAPLIKGSAVRGPAGGDSTTAAPSGSGNASGGSVAKPATKPKDAATEGATAVPQGPIGFTAPNTTPAVPAAPPAAAIIWVNGNRQTVGVKQLFPLKAPAFRLVSVDRKTMRIRVAGGSFTGGRAVITLPRGRAVTLVNTTTGVRYVIRFATALAALPASDTATAPGPASDTKTAKSK